MISPEIRAQIRRYFYVEHWKIGTIASELNVHPDAVRNAIESERFNRTQPLRGSLVDPTWDSSARLSINIRDYAPRAFSRDSGPRLQWQHPAVTPCCVSHAPAKK